MPNNNIGSINIKFDLKDQAERDLFYKLSEIKKNKRDSFIIQSLIHIMTDDFSNEKYIKIIENLSQALSLLSIKSNINTETVISLPVQKEKVAPIQKTLVDEINPNISSFISSEKLDISDLNFDNLKSTQETDDEKVDFFKKAYDEKAISLE
jgi:hypothetical protein